MTYLTDENRQAVSKMLVKMPLVGTIKNIYCLLENSLQDNAFNNMLQKKIINKSEFQHIYISTNRDYVEFDRLDLLLEHLRWLQ